jgi:hypothetical protein
MDEERSQADIVAIALMAATLMAATMIDES